jgi:hypothetical protein
MSSKRRGIPVPEQSERNRLSTAEVAVLNLLALGGEQTRCGPLEINMGVDRDTLNDQCQKLAKMGLVKLPHSFCACNAKLTRKGLLMIGKAI